jgi:hypothetical protein
MGNNAAAELLMEAWPEGVTFLDDEGNLPLHMAFTDKKCLGKQAVQKLIHLYPESVIRTSAQGLVPLMLHNWNNITTHIK